MKYISIKIDKLAIGLSLICTVHCLFLPVILVILPALSSNLIGDEHFHQWMLPVVLPISLIALTMGCSRHQNLSVMLIGLLGLVILAIATFMGHGILGETGEKTASLFGASLIAFGHLRNHKLIKTKEEIASPSE